MGFRLAVDVAGGGRGRSICCFEVVGEVGEVEVKSCSWRVSGFCLVDERANGEGMGGLKFFASIPTSEVSEGRDDWMTGWQVRMGLGTRL